MRRAAGRILAALGLLVLAVTLTPLASWWADEFAGGYPRPPSSDVLIVLGGGRTSDGLLALSSYWRAVYAVRAWRERGFRSVILTGAGVSPLMKDFLVGNGVPTAAIVTEDLATSTRENALFVRPLLPASPHPVLLTSDYHMYRALRVFRKAGIDCVPFPVPDAAKRADDWLGRWPAFLDLLQESAKLAYYRVRGWI